MPIVSIRDLANGASRVVDAVNSSGRPALVTNRGRPVAAIVPISEEALEDWVLANAPEFLANMVEAETEIAAGEKGVELEDAFAALEEGPKPSASSAPSTPLAGARRTSTSGPWREDLAGCGYVSATGACSTLPTKTVGGSSGSCREDT